MVRARRLDAPPQITQLISQAVSTGYLIALAEIRAGKNDQFTERTID